MSKESAIEWTDATWNPVRGCTKVSAGCKNCYAETFAERFRGVPGHPYEQGFDLRLVPHKLEEPLRWKEPRRIFVNSMSDLFHEDIPLEYIQQVVEVMHRARQHTFQILTKRSKRLAELSDFIYWPANVWLGVSVESPAVLHRVDDLRAVEDDLQHLGPLVRFLSIEPLLAPIKAIDLTDIGWVIVGGESGPHARPMDPEWVRDVRDQCVAEGVPFFFKQWGGVRKKEAGRILDGRTWDEMPRSAK